MSTVMENFGKIVSYAFNSLDMSSAANDVVVVLHQDGTLHSSPFNVRFGKVKVLNPGDKVVMIEINGTLTSAVMKMGADGVAYWLRPTTNVTDRPESPLESPHRTAAAHAGELPNAFSLDGVASSASAPSLTRSPPNSVSSNVSSPRSPQLQAAAVDDSTIASPTLPPLAPVAVEVVDFANMSGEEKAKFGELYQSFARSEAAAAAAGDSSAAGGAAVAGGGGGLAAHAAATGITLSKFASYDDLAIGASGAEDMFRDAQASISLSTAVSGNDAAGGEDESVEYDDEEDDELPADDDLGDAVSDDVLPSGGTSSSRVFFKQTLTPMHTDLLKLGLRDGMNIVKYITPTTLRGRVVVEARIFLYTSADKMVISDIDGTVTKSDVWGHLLPLIGRDWTHPGICSLYTKIAQNGYRILYLTARSVSQVEQTRQFLWGIEQGGVRLPQGPVFTAPDRFFAALTKEVTKKAHEFKIACLQSIVQAFPLHSKPFYAGFGNRIGDVISYTATGIPKHKIFIIDTNSVLHVCHVKHSYKDLAHLVDHTFPPLAVRARSSLEGQLAGPLPVVDVSAAAPVRSSSMNTSNGGLREGESIDQDYNNFNYWRIPPEQLIGKRTPPPSPMPSARGIVGGNSPPRGVAVDNRAAAASNSVGGTSAGDAAKDELSGAAQGGCSGPDSSSKPELQAAASGGEDEKKKGRSGIWSKLWKSNAS